MIKLLLRVLFFLLLAVLAAAAGWLSYYATTPLHLLETPATFTLKPGSSLKSSARQLTSIGVLSEPWNFVALGRLLGKAGKIKAGNYELNHDLNPYELLIKLTQGDFTQRDIVFIEGWTFSQVRQALNDYPGVRHDTQKLSDREILERIGASEDFPEGLFFPDTYHFSEGASDLTILKRAYQTLQSNLGVAWAARAPNLPLANPYEALILASIIEKETGQATERRMVAAVFINRLRRGMKLQTDPTVIYGMGENFDGNIRKRDLEADTIYNTYTRSGLPPTPIALPGLASIQAALNPSDSKALYFVARGDGTSYFSETLEEHNHAVTKYQKGGRRQAR
ncbi:MAG: endolytic transglycosylase MltG [Burkholderiales bacterium]